MKETIKKLNDYFIGKILKKQFKIVEACEYTITIKIDRKYVFCIWLSGGEEFTKIYDGMQNSFIALEFDKKDRIKLFKTLNKIQMKYHKEVTIKAKKKQFDRLKKELNIK